jgi:NADH:ubiquinone oxidoreductase subunit 6 (subunit J)
MVVAVVVMAAAAAVMVVLLVVVVLAVVVVVVVIVTMTCSSRSLPRQARHLNLRPPICVWLIPYKSCAECKESPINHTTELRGRIK